MTTTETEYVRVNLQPTAEVKCRCGWHTPFIIRLPLVLDSVVQLDGLPLHGHGPALRGSLLWKDCSRCGRPLYVELVSVELIRYMKQSWPIIEVPEAWVSPYSNEERLLDIFRPIHRALIAAGVYDDG